MGKTLIDIGLRNELVEFLGNMEAGTTEQQQLATDLYGRLKPKRVHKAKEKDNGWVEQAAA